MDVDPPADSVWIDASGNRIICSKWQAQSQAQEELRWGGEGLRCEREQEQVGVRARAAAERVRASAGVNSRVGKRTPYLTTRSWLNPRAFTCSGGGGRGAGRCAQSEAL